MKLFVLLSLLIISQPLSVEENDWLVWNLKGEVKELLVTGYHAELLDDNWVIKDTSSITLARFDSNGNQTQEIFNKFHSYDSTVYSYDDKGKASKMITYDEEGLLIKAAVFSKHISPHRAALQKVYDSGGKLIEVWKYEYDGFLLSKQSTQYNEDDMINELIFIRNSNGEIVKKIFTTRREETIATTIDIVRYLEYDAKGNWLRRVDARDTDSTYQLIERAIEYY